MFRPSGITVQIVDVDRATGRVKIGIVAPRKEEVIRGELDAKWDRKTERESA